MSSLVALLQRPWSSAPIAGPIETPAPQALEAAARAGVLPLVARRLLARGDLDPATRTRAFQSHAAARVRHRAARARLAAALAALEAAGVVARAFKGPVFAELAYEDPSSRVSSDLDLFVAPDDLPAALRALAPLGYGPVEPVTPGALALAGGVELVVPGSLADPQLDLHVRLVKPLLGRRSPAPAGAPERVAGLATFDRPWTIALAALQLVQDHLALRRVVDLAAILGRSTPDDAARAAEVARRLGCARALQVWRPGSAARPPPRRRPTSTRPCAASRAARSRPTPAPAGRPRRRVRPWAPSSGAGCSSTARTRRRSSPRASPSRPTTTRARAAATWRAGGASPAGCSVESRRSPRYIQGMTREAGDAPEMHPRALPGAGDQPRPDAPAGKPDTPHPAATDTESDPAVDRARRRLLKAGAYMAPFVATFGVFVPNAHAQASPCQPCGPNCVPPPPCAPKSNPGCNPYSGGG
ncbi:MAG: nucleotidyltransferase family protein [Planctomycetes bacterium]|nr:nucleotidyltransferase family protein [Planctomycetota bacterium]